MAPPRPRWRRVLRIAVRGLLGLLAIVVITVAGVNGVAETAMSAGFAAAVGLLHYGARPRDYMPVRRDNARLLGKVRQRVKGWMEAFF